MANLTQAQATTMLRALGWRIRSNPEYVRTVKNFQAGWNLGPALTVDGSMGPATSAALVKSDAQRRKGLPTASPHFSFTEVRCRCGGKYSACQRIWQKRAAFVMMEQYRDKSNRSLSVVSGCRCTSHNAAVGGSKTSRHVTGLACDVKPVFSAGTVKSWRVATHIGYSPSLRKVVHIDMGAGATRTNPRVYPDGR